MQIATITKKRIATKERTSRNKTPKPIEMMVNRIAVRENIARL